MRATPALSNIGMVDRSGQDVTVVHDRDRPEHFLAPRNGRSHDRSGPLMGIAFSLVVLAAAVAFAVYMQSML